MEEEVSPWPKYRLISIVSAFVLHCRVFWLQELIPLQLFQLWRKSGLTVWYKVWPTSTSAWLQASSMSSCINTLSEYLSAMPSSSGVLFDPAHSCLGTIASDIGTMYFQLHFCCSASSRCQSWINIHALFILKMQHNWGITVCLSHDDSCLSLQGCLQYNCHRMAKSIVVLLLSWIDLQKTHLEGLSIQYKAFPMDSYRVQAAIRIHMLHHKPSRRILG